MPIVFVHGVPDTQRVWDVVVSRLERKDVVTPPLPGFGCPLPSGFSATKEAYVEWLLGQLGALPGPVDLVGHDWGGLLAVRAVSLRPDAVRTWAAASATTSEARKAINPLRSPCTAVTGRTRNSRSTAWGSTAPGTAATSVSTW